MSERGRLPTFLIIGAQKAGTTSLSAWLGDHPDVFMSPKKEIHFFNTANHAKGEAWYRRHFAGADKEIAVGEATPLMAHPKAPARIAALLPDVRLIAVLRDPADRAYSQWVHLHEVGKERREFSESIRAEEADPDRPVPGLGYPAGYLDRGRYLAHLKAFTEHIARSRLHVLLMEDLRDDPARAVVEICRFLGIPETVPARVGEVLNPRPSFRSHRVQLVTRSLALRRGAAGRVAAMLQAMNRRPARSYSPMDPGMRDHLVKRFANENRALSAWLGRDLSAWMG